MMINSVFIVAVMPPAKQPGMRIQGMSISTSIGGDGGGDNSVIVMHLITRFLQPASPNVCVYTENNLRQKNPKPSHMLTSSEGGLKTTVGKSLSREIVRPYAL